MAGLPGTDRYVQSSMTVVISSDKPRPRSLGASPLIDPFGRVIDYLRVSVTDRCDLRCTYCMLEKQTFLPRAELLTIEELDRLCSTFIGLGTTRLRLTGGEPLVRKGFMDLIAGLSLGFETALSPAALMFCFFGVSIGMFIGVLPGIGPLAAVAWDRAGELVMREAARLRLFAGVPWLAPQIVAAAR